MPCNKPTVPCKGCGETIIWLATKGGKQMPANVLTKTIITPDGETIRGP